MRNAARHCLQFMHLRRVESTTLDVILPAVTLVCTTIAIIVSR
jgi:hypothetical protein